MKKDKELSDIAKKILITILKKRHIKFDELSHILYAEKLNEAEKLIRINDTNLKRSGKRIAESVRVSLFKSIDRLLGDGLLNIDYIDVKREHPDIKNGKVKIDSKKFRSLVKKYKYSYITKGTVKWTIEGDKKAKEIIEEWKPYICHAK